MNLHRTLLAAALLALMRSVAAESPPTPAAPAATVEQPRSFGHVLGDVLTQRVLLSHAGRPVDAGALPAADRVGLYLERRTPRVEEDALGRRWLAIDYQVVNAPRALTAAALPGLGAYWIYGWAQRIVGASHVAVALYLGPLYASIGAWWMLGEPPGWHHLVGAALILPGIFLVTSARR